VQLVEEPEAAELEQSEETLLDIFR
jgi:hypothetical protein